MSEIAKTYTPKEIEAKWQEQWLENKAFKAVVDPVKDPFCIMIPPPNVTGILHIGHVLNNTLQDVFIRRARMEGKSALWLPGTDHAGIATQTKVERILREEEGKTKYDLGREAFLERVWAFREENGGVILKQLQKLGTSCDWDLLLSLWILIMPRQFCALLLRSISAATFTAVSVWLTGVPSRKQHSVTRK